MSEKTNIRPTLIVGAGLAGVCVARRLYEQGHPFRVIDSGINTGSRVAAGIINPLVFRRMTKSWRIDEFLPEAEAFYKGLSEAWGTEYYAPMPIRRAFSHQQETDLWIEKQETEAFGPYMKTLDSSDMQNDSVINTFGTGKVLQSAFVRTVPFLDDAKRWLQGENVFIDAAFDHAQLDPETGKYQGETYAEVIFCEGYQGIYNPWFSWLPLETTKGEILTVSSAELPENELLNRKCFILPIGGQKFRIGATYSWRSPNTELTDDARELLIQHAQSLTNASFEILTQEAGVRPTVQDRRPLLGTHPEFQKLKIFNGLGTKGYMMAPLLSQEFIAYLKNGSSLDPEVDIKRYEKLRTNT